MAIVIETNATNLTRNVALCALPRGIQGPPAGGTTQHCHTLIKHGSALNNTTPQVTQHSVPSNRKTIKTPPPPMSIPPPLSTPPRGGGGASPTSTRKDALVSFCTALRNCETSFSDLMCAYFVLTHCTPQTSQNVPSRRCCALCPFHKGACVGRCARPFSPWRTIPKHPVLTWCH